MPDTQIDVVILPKGPAGTELIETTLRGPIHEQVRAALRYIRNDVIREKVIKHPDRAEATRIFNYPFEAIEEALVNAVYHRGYDQREPVEVRVHPEAIYILSYPGPDPSIRTEDLAGERILARRYRNRRIGEFFKELDLTEGRCTGIPIMREVMARNGSPPPKFTTDQGRTYFLVELPVHPQLRGVLAPEGTDQATAQPSTKLALSRHQVAILEKCREETGLVDLMTIAARKDRTKFRQQVLNPLLGQGLIEMTIPDKPRSSIQKYRLTAAGRQVLGNTSGE